jgi:CDP-diacylglycerol--serine O-phosphatidyltransferase
MGVICTFKGNFEAAFCLMLAAAVCDFCDGFSARLLKAYSNVGKELDSLADTVSFGVAPAMIAFNKMLEIYNIEFANIFSFDSGKAAYYLFMLACTLMIAVFSGLRLAKFNIDTRQSENFIGLATPSCALIIGSLVYSIECYPQISLFFENNTWIIPVLSLALSLLLVSEIPMFSFKFKSFGWAQNKLKYIFLLCATAIAVTVTAMAGHFAFSIWIFATFLFYILLNTTIWLIGKRKQQ